MNTTVIRNFVFDHFPDNKKLKSLAAKRRVWKLEKYLLPVELLEESEKDSAKKEQVVKEHSQKYPKLCRFTDKEIEKTISSSPIYKGRNDLDAVRTDMRFCYYGYGFLPEEYTYFLLENKTMEERLQFISDIQKKICVFKMSDFVEMQILKDKERTYDFFKPYFKREAIGISKQSDYKKFCSFVDKYPIFVKKPFNLCMGSGVGLINLDTCGKTKKQVFDELIKNGKHILEEPIRQSAITEQFNSSSVNSVRFFTFNTKEGIFCPFGYFRSGRKGSFVDNGGAGGIFAGIDMNTGILCSDGMDEKAIEYRCHPESGIEYNGYQLPDWDGLVNLCKKLAGMMPKVKYIGWDMAYTDNGWVIVEANRAGQPLMQAPMHHGVRQVYEDMMSKMDLMY